MFLSLKDMLQQAEIINLNSLFDGWTRDVATILAQQTFAPDNPRLSIPLDRLILRLNELKFMCLVDRLAITMSRSIFPPIVSRARSQANNSECDQCPDYLDRLRNVSARDNDRNACPRRNDDYPWLSDKTINSHSVNSSRPPSEPPHYGGECGQNEPTEVAVVVDCSGMYVSSLRKWLKGMKGSPSFSRTMESLLVRLDRFPDQDGPAVLLCPDMIEAIYGDAVRRCPPVIRLVFKELATNPSLMFLKFTLLHELGHHVFPVGRQSPSTDLSEAFADWFTYWLIPPGERVFLHDQAQDLARPYRLYEGLLPLLFPVQTGSILTTALASYCPTNLALWLETMAFSGFLSVRPNEEAEEIIKEIDSACWYLINTYPFNRDYHRFCNILPEKDTCLPLHPTWEYAITLISEAFPVLGKEKGVRDFMKNSREHFRLMSPSREREWLERIWALPRPAYS